MSREDLRAQILWKLFRCDAYGDCSKYENVVLSGIPKHLIGDAKNELSTLVKEGLILIKPHNQGIKYFLNPERETEWHEEILKAKRYQPTV